MSDAAKNHHYYAQRDGVARFDADGQGVFAWAHDAKDAEEIVGELNELLERAEKAEADCKAMAAALGNAFPMKNVHVSCGTASHVVVFLGVLETPELLAVVRRWRP